MPGTQYFSLGVESVLEPVGEPQLQARVQRHYKEDMGNVCPFVQILDLLVPQMVDTVLEFFRLLELPVAEQVIEVPKIVSADGVEQLVALPTVLSCASLQQRNVEHAFQFLVMVPVKVFKVFLPDMVPDSVLWNGTLVVVLLVVVWFTTELVAANCGTDRRHSCPWS